MGNTVAGINYDEGSTWFTFEPIYYKTMKIKTIALCLLFPLALFCSCSFSKKVASNPGLDKVQYAQQTSSFLPMGQSSQARPAECNQPGFQNTIQQIPVMDSSKYTVFKNPATAKVEKKAGFPQKIKHLLTNNIMNVQKARPIVANTEEHSASNGIGVLLLGLLFAGIGVAVAILGALAPNPTLTIFGGLAFLVGLAMVITGIVRIIIAIVTPHKKLRNAEEGNSGIGSILVLLGLLFALAAVVFLSGGFFDTPLDGIIGLILALIAIFFIINGLEMIMAITY